jgi:hypothetical protein
MKRKRNKIIIALIVFILLYLLIDWNYWMPKRVTTNLWEYRKGLYFGEHISNNQYSINGHKMNFYNGKKCYFLFSCLDILIIYDSKTRKIGCYAVFKGSKAWH